MIAVGFDVGTQGTKAVALDLDSLSVVGTASLSYGLIEGLEPGACEQHPDTWRKAVKQTAEALRGQFEADKVVAVGVSGQQHGLVVLDEVGEVVRPAKLWCDTTTATEAAEISRALGRHVPTGFTAPKVLWMQRREAHLWGRVHRVLLPHDAINLMLTGEAGTEPGDASGTGWLDVAARDYDARAIDMLGLEGLLAPLRTPGQPLGSLSADGARLLGFPEGATVSTGGGDNMMSAVGSGATEPGVTVISLGTSGTAFAYSPEPVLDPEGLIAGFCDSTDGWLPLLCVMNLTGTLHEVAGMWPDNDFRSLSEAASKVAPGSEGVCMVPYLRGERVPDIPDATGMFTGLRAGSMRPEVLFRAALEGTAMSMALGVERLRALSVPVEGVRLVGGGANNPLWRQIFADAIGVPVTPLEQRESAALGAAVHAAWTHLRKTDPDASIVPLSRAVANEGAASEPDPAGREAMQALGERFVDLLWNNYGVERRTPGYSSM